MWWAIRDGIEGDYSIITVFSRVALAGNNLVASWIMEVDKDINRVFLNYSTVEYHYISVFDKIIRNDMNI